MLRRGLKSFPCATPPVLGNILAALQKYRIDCIGHARHYGCRALWMPALWMQGTGLSSNNYNISRWMAIIRELDKASLLAQIPNNSPIIG